MKVQFRYPRVPALSFATRHRSPMWRFALPVFVVLALASWQVAWELRGRVAPMGVATSAEPRHADVAPARVVSMPPEERHEILLCQALGPAAPCNICAVDGGTCNPQRGWEAARMIAWQAYAQGEYVGHARLAHVPEYRLRVDDQLDMTYRLTREETATPYRLNVGDEIRVESFTDPELNRDLLIQPDGTITLRLLGQVHATGRTVTQLRDALDNLYKKYYKIPAITVTPLKVNTKLEDLRATIDRRAGIGGQSQAARVTPEGTIALPAIGSVQAQGLTLGELQTELNECYRQVVEGIQVIPILVQRAPRFVYVLGEVYNPGRFELSGPTTALQALSMAGSWRVGANLRQIVVFRRGDDWRLMATMIDLQAALFGPPADPARRNLDRRLRRDHRSEGEDPRCRRLHRTGFHSRHLWRLSALRESGLREARHALDDRLEQGQGNVREIAFAPFGRSPAEQSSPLATRCCRRRSVRVAAIFRVRPVRPTKNSIDPGRVAYGRKTNLPSSRERRDQVHRASSAESLARPRRLPATAGLRVRASHENAAASRWESATDAAFCARVVVSPQSPTMGSQPAPAAPYANAMSA